MVLSSFFKCSVHTGYAPLRRMVTSKNALEYVTSFYNTLRSTLKHFVNSPKSTEILKEALATLERNEVHILNWGSTRICGFLDGCKRSSEILVPFLDTVVVANIQAEQKSFLLTAKALFLLELFADLHPIFANEYVHHVDSDSILVCEVTAVAEAIFERFTDLDTLPTPKSVAFLKFGC